MLITRLTCMLSVCTLAASMCLGQQAVKKMTNEDITAMVSLGLTDEVIIDKVHAAGATDFDTSITGLTAQKQATLSEAATGIWLFIFTSRSRMQGLVMHLLVAQRHPMSSRC